MKNRILNVLLLTLIFTMLLASCSFSGDSLMTLRFSIVNDRARTISSGTADIEIAKYTFTLTPKNRTTEAITETFDKKASGTYDMKNITPGSYSLKVEGKTQDGSVISEASQDVFLEREDQKNSSKIIEVELTALSGKQSVNIVYTWDVNSYSNNMTVKLNIKKQGAAAGNDVDLELNQAAGTATYTGELNAGSYIFTATLQKGSTVYVGHVEVIRVTNSSSTLSQTIAIDQKAVMALSTNVTEKIASPIEGTITITKNTTDNFKLSVKITKKPDGVEDKDISVIWYNEDVTLATTNAATPVEKTDLLPGCTRVTAVMWCPDIPGSMGAASDFGVN